MMMHHLADGEKVKAVKEIRRLLGQEGSLWYLDRKKNRLDEKDEEIESLEEFLAGVGKK